MRRRLEELLNETFEYETPQLQLTGDLPGGQARENETLSGTLVLSHPEGKKIRGFVYTSSPRMACSVQDFYSAKPQVRWQLDLTGMGPGESTQGSIIFCTDIGEKEVSYVVSILEPDTRITVPDVDGLAKLAAADFDSSSGLDARSRLNCRCHPTAEK